MIKWNIQNVREVYLNGDGVAGVGAKTAARKVERTFSAGASWISTVMSQK
ncbi:MAG: hypothetical protein R2838_15350 [Caldilineaceae bacterium]